MTMTIVIIISINIDFMLSFHYKFFWLSLLSPYAVMSLRMVGFQALNYNALSKRHSFSCYINSYFWTDLPSFAPMDMSDRVLVLMCSASMMISLPV